MTPEVKEAAIRDLAEYVGLQIKLARTARRVTAREVAELAGITPVTMSRIERGQCDMKLSTLAAIRSVLALDITIQPMGRTIP